MNRYIINEEQLLDTKSYIYHEDEVAFERIYRVVRSNPYNPQAEREKVLEALNKMENILTKMRQCTGSCCYCEMRPKFSECEKEIVELRQSKEEK